MRLWRPLLALLTVFALSGCMKLQMDLSIDGEADAVSGSFIYAIDKQVLAMSGKPAEETFNSSVKDLKQLPAGTRQEVYDDGKFYGRKVFFDKTPFEKFNRQDPGSPHFEHRDGKYYFTMDLSGQNTGAGKQVLDQIEVKVSVTFPGKVIDRDNLAELHGKTVSWTVKMSAGHKFSAVSEEGSRVPWILVGVVGGIFGLLVVAGIVVLALRMNRKPALEEPTIQVG